MTVCKLTYFNYFALAEPIRLILAYNHVEFEDIRLDRYGKEWKDAKTSFKFGQLPLLEIDGLELYHSTSICRYLANKYELNGQNFQEASEVDMVVETIYDLMMKMRTLLHISDPDENEKKYQEFKNTTILTCLKTLDSAVKNGHLACEKLTWADFFLTGAALYLSKLCQLDVFEGYTNLKSVHDKLVCAPELSEYMRNRVKCEC